MREFIDYTKKEKLNKSYSWNNFISKNILTELLLVFELYLALSLLKNLLTLVD